MSECFFMTDLNDINSQTFQSFLSPSCNRQQFIQSFLNSHNLDAPIISLEGKNHIYVKFSQSQYNPMFKIKTVIAHYDRVNGSPGANDNSAAVFTLLQWAVKLSKEKSFHNIRLIFTDGEELGSGGIASQGAFPLASTFRKLGITNDDIFVFDCMGRGDVPIIAQTTFPKSASSSFIKKYNDLELYAQKVIQNATGGKWFSLPCNYSDNASFIANGIPAVTITMLPSSEVTEVLQGCIPYTWSLLHTPQDNFESLTPQSFELMNKILLTLSLTHNRIY